MIDLVLSAKQADLPGGLHVRRALPQMQRRIVGPFVFVDQMGPITCEADRELTVLPHPHIGLATVTFLFEGVGLHRDSLGSVQPLLPGEVNWMTAGKGIVHSERMRSGASGRMAGLQTWVALPRAIEECEPTFAHYGADAVPILDGDKVRTRLIAGTLFGARSAVVTASPLFYADARMEFGATLALTTEHEERAAFVYSGSISVGATQLREGEIAFFTPGVAVDLRADAPAHVILLGGAPLDGPRYISWNFVSSDKRRLAQAAADWRHQRFPRVPGETQYIPLPADGDAPVDYP